MYGKYDRVIRVLPLLINSSSIRQNKINFILQRLSISVEDQLMSLASKITLGASVAFLSGSCAFVFYDKEIIKRKMHKGVVLDLKRQEEQQKNLANLERQQHVEKQYRDAQQQKITSTSVS